MTQEQPKENKKLGKELKKLVLWRIESIPQNFKLSIGGKGTFSKEELKEEVEKESEVGLAFAEMQLNFIKALVSGKLSKVLAE